MAEGLDLVTDLSSVFEFRVEGEVSFVGSEVVELDRAWVAVVVNIPPTSLNCLHSLVWFSIKINFLTGNVQF